MAEMEEAFKGDHNIAPPPILISSSEIPGLEFTVVELETSNFDAPAPISAQVKRTYMNRRKLISSPNKPNEGKRKQTSTDSTIEESLANIEERLAKSDEVMRELVETMKNEAKERKKERKAAARQHKALMMILAAGVLAKHPGNEEEADKMVRSAVADSSDLESD
jgi:ribosomal protein S6